MVMHWRLVAVVGAVPVTQPEGRIGGLGRPSLTLALSKYLDDPSKDGEWTASVAATVTIRRR
jgi:hypothetical protein